MSSHTDERDGDRPRWAKERLNPNISSFAFLGLAAFLLILAIGGGSASVDQWSLLYVRPAAIFLSLGLLVFSKTTETPGNPVVAPMILLGLLALYMVVQLVPLPSILWANMPGHDRYREADRILGSAPWRPISLTPRLTWNSLLAVAIPAAVFIALSKGAGKSNGALVNLWLLIGLLGLSLGLLQIVSPEASTLYFYQNSSQGQAPGLFANRNHGAVFLTVLLPVMVIWIDQQRALGKRRRWVVEAIAVVIVLLIGIGVLATESRAGIVFGCMSGMISLPIYLIGIAPARRFATLLKLVLPFALLVLTIGGLSMMSGHGGAIARTLDSHEYASDLRAINAPVVKSIAYDFFPFGTGFGSFDAVFRGYESDATLSPLFFNHAHNDILELFMTGGLPAISLAGAMAVWWLLRTIRAWRRRSTISLAGSAIISLLVGASLVDYPLRTPLTAALFATACWWLGRSTKGVVPSNAVSKNHSFTRLRAAAIPPSDA